MSEITWRFTCTDEEEQAFTHGDCLFFAAELYRRVGGEIVFVIQTYGDWMEEDACWGWTHAMLRTDDGIFDITGRWEVDRDGYFDLSEYGEPNSLGEEPFLHTAAEVRDLPECEAWYPFEHGALKEPERISPYSKGRSFPEFDLVSIVDRYVAEMPEPRCAAV